MGLRRRRDVTPTEGRRSFLKAAVLAPAVPLAARLPEVPEAEPETVEAAFCGPCPTFDPGLELALDGEGTAADPFTISATVRDN